MDDHITAGNSVGRVTDTLLRNDLIIVEEIGFAPLDDTGTQLLLRFIAAACERRAPGRRAGRRPALSPSVTQTSSLAWRLPIRFGASQRAYC